MAGLRKNCLAMSQQERDRFVAALKAVKGRGVVDRFADIHERHFAMNIHRSSHFLPWHREMLLRFEQQLQAVDASVYLPYWDSSVDQAVSAALWDPGFLGQFDPLWGLGRALGSDVLPTPQQVANNQARPSYAAFWPELESAIHNPPHRWVGGRMRSAASPHDPVFYLHHAWIDLLWVRWQAGHPGATFTQSIAGAGLNDPFMEWTDRTPADVLDHHALGHAYDTEAILTGPAPSSPDMQPGEVLAAGASITSADGRFTFVYQTDGNLVLYGPAGAMWASDTEGTPVGTCVMQGDGNLVIYGPGGVYVWDSATDGNPGAHLVVQDDGNVVIYRPDGTPVWDTGTWMPTGPRASSPDMQPGEVLVAGAGITSADGRFTFVYQTDGNLVLYGPAGAMWASDTEGTPVGTCVMQGDGNLVIYGPGGVYVWDSATDGNPGAHLVVQDDGNVVIYSTTAVALWATGTG